MRLHPRRRGIGRAAKIAALYSGRRVHRLIALPPPINRLLHRQLRPSRHCEHRCRVFTAVMRHFLVRNAALGATCAPAPLSGRVPVRSAATLLISHSGRPHTQPPLLARAIPSAVNLAVIALIANARRDPAATAIVLPIVRLANRNAQPRQGLDNALRCVHKSVGERASRTPPHRGPGSTAKSGPGLRLFGVSSSE